VRSSECGSKAAERDSGGLVGQTDTILYRSNGGIIITVLVSSRGGSPVAIAAHCHAAAEDVRIHHHDAPL
jgi:hypothetical protein